MKARAMHCAISLVVPVTVWFLPEATGKRLGESHLLDFTEVHCS
jgi:hypothetical protein